MLAESKTRQISLTSVYRRDINCSHTQKMLVRKLFADTPSSSEFKSDSSPQFWTCCPNELGGTMVSWWWYLKDGFSKQQWSWCTVHLELVTVSCPSLDPLGMWRESTPSPSQGSDHTGGLEAKNDFSLLSSVFVALPDIIKKPRAEPWRSSRADIYWAFLQKGKHFLPLRNMAGLVPVPKLFFLSFIIFISPACNKKRCHGNQ